MRVIQSIDEMLEFSGARHGRRQRLALVPTMGALHEGHFALMDRARTKCPMVVTSIFVNPAQFGPGEDFGRYPRPLDDDLRVLQEHEVDAVFAPSAEEMYPAGFTTHVDPGRIATILEGAARPGHFRGVATVVLKLFQIVHPDVACFGQKDFQQALMITKLVEDLNLGVELEIVPIVREADGLAKSSRNAYLTVEQRRAATAISAALRRAQEQWSAGERSPAAVVETMVRTLAAEWHLQPEYVTVREPKNLEPPASIDPGSVALVAARLGSTRLIDNVIFGPRQMSEEELVNLSFPS